MYNLQKAKQDIDAVAKHATDVTEYVIALGEMLQSSDSRLDARLDALKADLLQAIDARLAEVRRAVLGDEGQPAETSFVSDLGSKVSFLKQRPTAAAPHEHAPDHASDAPHPDHQG